MRETTAFWRQSKQQQHIAPFSILLFVPYLDIYGLKVCQDFSKKTEEEYSFALNFKLPLNKRQHKIPICRHRNIELTENSDAVCLPFFFPNLINRFVGQTLVLGL